MNMIIIQLTGIIAVMLMILVGGYKEKMKIYDIFIVVMMMIIITMRIMKMMATVVMMTMTLTKAEKRRREGGVGHNSKGHVATLQVQNITEESENNYLTISLLINPPCQNSFYDKSM